MLSDKQCLILERTFLECAEPRCIGAYLCLHMGLSVSEAAGLMWHDINLTDNIVTVRRYLKRVGSGFVTAETEARVMRTPLHVRDYLALHVGGGGIYVMSGTDAPAGLHSLQNLLSSVAAANGWSEPVSPGDLRDAFIRRAAANGADIYSVCRYCGIKRTDTFMKRYGSLFGGGEAAIVTMTPFFSDAKAEAPAVSRLRLIVIGAGKNRGGVKRLIDSVGVFDEIRFLDDHSGADAPISECVRLRSTFQAALVCFEDPDMRERYTDMLESLGYALPSLRQPDADISHGAVIERTVIIGKGATVHKGAVVMRGAVIANGAVIEADAVVGSFSYIGASATVERGAVIPAKTDIPSGTIVHRFDFQ